MDRLYVIPYSPWSEIARWSLLHHKQAFKEIEHVVLVGEIQLRLRAKSNHASVPLLTTANGPKMGARTIADYAECGGSGSPLFPIEYAQEINRWFERAEAVANAMRALAAGPMRSSNAFLKEALPGWVPSFATALMLPTARLSLSFLAQKHGYADTDLAAFRLLVLDFAADVNAASEKTGYLCGDSFTMADLACAASLEFARPVNDQFIKLGPNTRAVLTSPLAQKIEATLSWRDRIYEQHRPIA